MFTLQLREFCFEEGEVVVVLAARGAAVRLAVMQLCSIAWYQ